MSTLLETIRAGYQTVRGMLPFKNVPDTFVMQDQESIQRARYQKYKHNWEVYKGVSLDAMRSEDGTPATKVNYLKKNIDKINWFAFGRPYSLTHKKFQNALDVAQQCWGPNRVEKFLRIAQFGAITGDAFVMVAPTKVADAIVKYNAGLADYEAKVPAQVHIVVLGSQYCTPTYDAFDSDVLLAMDISIPMIRRDENGKSINLFQHMTITKAEVTTVIRGENGKDVEAPATVPNPINEVYVRHIRNFPCGDSVYGLDDVLEVMALNDIFTERLTDIGNIIAYHAAPTTVIFGARSQNLQRGPNKVWGNLPKDAKVENLQLGGDLPASNEYLSRIKEGIHEIMGVPEIAQGSKQAISNTSGIALHTMYMPLIERAVTKQSVYGPHFIEISILAIKWLQELKLMRDIGDDGEVKPKDGRTKDLTDDDFEDIRQNCDLKFVLPLPKDKLIEAQIQTTLMAAGLQSQRGALVEMGERHPDDKIAEIDADQEKKLEQQKALMEAEGSIKTAGAVTQIEAAAAVAPKKIESGAGAAAGEQKTASDAPKGRPKGT